MRERYLFFADRDVTTYRDLLEIRPGRARLVTPSEAARSFRWVSSIAFFVGYTAIAGPVCFLGIALGIGLLLPYWIGAVVAVLVWGLGLFSLYIWWDRHNLPFLAESPANAIELQLLGARSLGAVQDVRARTPDGQEMHLVVDSRAPRFWEAVRFLEGKAIASR